MILAYVVFTDAWKQCKFGEIAYRVSTSCADKSLPQVEYEDVKCRSRYLEQKPDRKEYFEEWNSVSAWRCFVRKTSSLFKKLAFT